MKSRPTIFLSGVSHEFGSFRDAVENQVEMKGCFAENQPGFPPDYRSVEEMLRRKLDDSDAIVHIVGFRFGAEPKPNDAPVDKPHRSYTQLEFDIAREMQKLVYVFLSADESVRDKPRTNLPPEDDEAVALQLEHRKAVQSTNHLYYFFKDKAELCKLVAEIEPVASSAFRSDISRIVKYAPSELIGRETETAILNDAWNNVRQAETFRHNVLTFVALGGEGKTSLVAKWVADLAHQDWPGCDAVFAWSFYSQGTRDQVAASSDLFLGEALRFFGDAAVADSPAGAFDKGKRLAQLIGERRALLILDGLEPLQYSPTSPTPGELKDQGIEALLKGLASNSHGLCVVTTRYSIPDLKAFWQTTAPEYELLRLSTNAGVDLLRRFGVKGSQAEFETLVEDVKGHALTLNLLGGFLKRAFKGDIRQRDRVKFEKADDKIQGGHAFRTIAAYVNWMQDESDEARRELAILQLLGLFDRPASADCIRALIAEPVIPGLTEPLVRLADDDWEFSLTGLEEAKLLTVNRDDAGTMLSLDAHPLLREYFAKWLRSHHAPRDEPASADVTNQGSVSSSNDAATIEAHLAERDGYFAWQTGHRRLYEHLCETTPDKPEATLEDLQPLYTMSGFQYCDLLLAAAESAAWLATLSANGGGQRAGISSRAGASFNVPGSRPRLAEAITACHAVSARTTQTLKWSTEVLNHGLLPIALDHLTLGRAALYTTVLEGSEISNSKSEIEQAVSGLRRAGTTHHLPRALLTRAWLRSLTGPQTGPDSAQSDLDEAWEIVERGPMPLFMADIHLCRARLFGHRSVESGKPEDEADEKYPWQSVQHDLAEARRLIEKHGYGRRLEELKDAQAALLGSS